VFGREEVARHQHFRQKKWKSRAGEEQAEREGPTMVTASRALEKVRLALTSMGFRDAEARRAIAQVEKMHCYKLTVEQKLREAILVASAGSCVTRS
jgi:Holliday junction resolvasome RuvABC DNA-binding subunit